ncbi:malto-oligosyltrehalose synthase [Flaviflexus huanghaiensis]|uniref:malto-oligosyltrehalose synthase n=1 Tax=Flaviflexus huanghaiensis TaxID=1111473 RepID=UPI0015FB752F|nr:malto-oligosyltrehalose synthase [Flaviflexus huanghaiensis]
MPERHAHSHAPREGRRQPVSTYRLQLGPDLTFSQAKKLLPYLHNLGATDIYCSPILQAVPGSAHGYDVVDHSTISAEIGGERAFRSMADEAHKLGMGVIVDVVPNHMAVPTPLYLNKELWSVLKYGPESPYVDWFDIEIEEGGEGVLMPVLGTRIGTALADETLSLETRVVPGFEDEGEQHVLTYYDHIFPVKDQTEALPLADLIERQFYRLAYWKVANEELNYRRFFDVDTLAAVRVERDEVFAKTHSRLLTLYDKGYIDGFRIDHPDGLADPRGYFRDLSEATGGAWVVAEKILDGDEELPDDWPVAGTTGYDSAWRIQALQTDPNGIITLGTIMEEIAGDSAGDLPAIITEGKQQIITESLFAEIDRLAEILSALCRSDVRLRDHTFRSLRESVVALILEMDRYRAYVVPGERPNPQAERALREAAERAKKRLVEDRHETLDIVVELLLGAEIGSAGRTHEKKRAELIIRFQQACGPVMAKGIEDTAFYRWTLLLSSCEVGSYAFTPTYSADQMHAWVQRTLPAWPVTMTAGTTHDTKRGEDVRARISVLSQYAPAWRSLLEEVRELAAKQHPANLDGRTENLLWQTIFGTWTDRGPISHDRLVQYLEKASREQKAWTTWTEPNEDAENALFMFARYLITDPKIGEKMTEFYEYTAPAVRSVLLAIKAIQLTILGVADNYQGEEITQNSLVDPDNRRPVHYGDIIPMLEKLDEHGLGSHPTLDEEKLWLVSRILRLRRDIPDVFVGGGYKPLPVTTGHAFAFARTVGDEARVAVITERLHAELAQTGFGDHTVVVPDGTWTDILTGNSYEAGSIALADLLSSMPVAILRRED